MYYEVPHTLVGGYYLESTVRGAKKKTYAGSPAYERRLDLPSLSNLQSTVEDNEGLSVSTWAILTLNLSVSASTNSVGSPILWPFDSWLNCVDFD